TLRLFLNGVEVASRAQTEAIATSQNPLEIGGDVNNGQYFEGLIDELRIYDRALRAPEIQADMNTPIDAPPSDTVPPNDTVPPQISVTAPAPGSTQFDVVTLSADASDDVGVARVDFLVD